MDKFVKRQKIASEARKEKERLLNKNNGDKWVKKTTVFQEFSLTNSVKI